MHNESTELEWYSGDCAGRNNKRKEVHSKHMTCDSVNIKFAISLMHIMYDVYTCVDKLCETCYVEVGSPNSQIPPVSLECLSCRENIRNLATIIIKRKLQILQTSI